MAQTDDWIAHLRANNRKENTLHTHRSNVSRCLHFLALDGRPTDAFEIGTDDIQYLWRTIPVKEEVRIAYLRSLSNMVIFHTGVDIVKKTDILRNRESVKRVFLDDDVIFLAYEAADPLQRVVICLGAYMGLRRGEIASIRDSDFRGNEIVVHGKGHGEGLITRMEVPEPVMQAIREYREWNAARGERTDDYLIQSRSRQGGLHRMKPDYISMSFCKLSRKIGKPFTVHSLRRYYATVLYYLAGCDLQTVRKLMRHADVSTTLRCYVDAYDGPAKEASKKLADHVSGVISQAGSGQGKKAGSGKTKKGARGKGGRSS